MSRASQKWIGLANVTPKPGNDLLGTGPGAFVVSIAWANSARDYFRKVVDVLNEEGFDVVQIEDIDTFEDRIKNQTVASEILELAEQVTEDDPVSLATSTPTSGKFRCQWHGVIGSDRRFNLMHCHALATLNADRSGSRARRESRRCE